ncbi:MAG: hypothetical protein U5K36_15045 [Roseovarius sp.]|nr:hypothetical protein [Roseovarius sp.]
MFKLDTGSLFAMLTFTQPVRHPAPNGIGGIDKNKRADVLADAHSARLDCPDLPGGPQ